VSAAFLICDIAVRPIPERMHNSALLNCRYGNFAARKSNAAMVVDENESVSTGLSCFAEFVFISIPLLFSASICSYEHLRQESADDHFAEGEEEGALSGSSLPPCSRKAVKKFRRSQEDVSNASEKAGERTAPFKTSRKKTGGRAFVSREFWSKCAGASAPRNLNPHCL
jgi:hypothetical protein